MSRPYEETCKCGVDNNITEFSIDEGLWCCKTTQDKCTVEEYTKVLRGRDTTWKNVTCQGKAISLSQQCHDADDLTPSCNYFPEDFWRNSGTNKQTHYLSGGTRSHYLDGCFNNR